LDKSPFKSCRSIVKLLPIAHSRVLQHLHESFGFKSFHLHLVAYILTGNWREERKEYARAMLPFLHIAERNGCHHLVILNESWFFFNTLRPRMQTRLRDDMATNPRHDIRRKKFLFRNIWNPSGFDIVDRLLKCTKKQGLFRDKSTYSTRKNDLPSRKGAAWTTTVVDLDNCSVRTSRVSTD
jgi:hypothetical protein